ncbi:MAG TPA: TonB-dependent receptor plug domain-containing protein, partial [Longimicrobiales bacterium]|nr:TonB-dependent receptor plug domain-containing protein [Longimicrobiales bacterium]
MDHHSFEPRRRKTVRGLGSLAAALAFVALGATGSAAQDTGTVTGAVRDAVDQSPIPNAQISVAGTNLGQVTSNTGRYLLLNVPSGQQTVRVQIIGYGAEEQTVNVPAGGSVTVDFNLHTEAIALEGVVVTGTAGQARKREVGNTVSQIGARDIEVAAVTDMGDVLQGRAAGIQVNDFSGQVGEGSQIRLRGNNSLTQGNNPLIYVDGVRIEVNSIGSDDEQGGTASLFDMVNPNDIDRVEVVKGPAATALYGTEAAGGVIQIFTKRGSAGAPLWTLSVDQGFSNMTHMGGSLNPESINPSGLHLNDCSDEPGCPDGGSWFRNAYLQRYDLSVRGGTDNASYFVSGRWGRQEGVIAPQGAEDYSLRANVAFQPFDGLDIRMNNAYSKRGITWIPDGNNAGGLLLNIMRGTAGYTPGNDDSVILNNELTQDIQNFQVGASINWTPNARFSHRLNVGMDYTESDFIDFKPWGKTFDAPEGDREDD